MFKLSRIFIQILRPARLMLMIVFFCCLIHIHQVYIGSKNVIDEKKRRRSMLFLSDERKFRRQEGLPVKVLLQARREREKDLICKPKRSLLFVKTHKTGSTTVTNIILRYAEKHRLSVGLPPPRHWQLGGYPAKFDSKIVTPQLPKYDVLCHHLRYKKSSVDSVLPSNATSITILRDAASNFESGFAFFRDWPYSRWFKNLSEPENLKLFLNNPLAYYDTSTPWYFRAKNYMAFDLGFNHEHNDLMHIEAAIQEMEKRYDLVLITERMEESLLLLKELLCMDSYDDIIHIRLKVRQDFARRSLTSQMESQIRMWNFLDNKIYIHFNKTLDRKIRSYGKSRMAKDLELFQQMLEKIEKKCVRYYDQFHLKPWISRIKLRDDAGEFCEKLSWGEVKYGDYMRKFQQSYIKPGRIRQPSYDELNVLLRKAQESVIGEIAVKNSA